MDFVLTFIQPGLRVKALQIFQIIRDSGLEDSFDIAKAAYRLMDDKEDFIQIRQGLEDYFNFDIAGGGPR